jgi:hypothetical protein
MRNPEHYRTTSTCAAITELWRRGSVVTSWLLDLTAQALADDPKLEKFSGKVSDSGEGRWTVDAANDLGVPANVLTASLFERFASRGLDVSSRTRCSRRSASASAAPRGEEVKGEGSPGGDVVVTKNGRSARTRWSSSAPRATSPTRRSSPRCTRWPARQARLPGVGVALGLGPRAAHRPRPGELHRVRRPGPRRAFASSRAAALRRRRLQRPGTFPHLRTELGGARRPVALPRDPAEPLRNGGPEAPGRPAAPRTRAWFSRSPSAATSPRRAS